MYSSERTPTLLHLLIGALCTGLVAFAATPTAVRAQSTNGGSGPSYQEAAQHYSLYYENFKNENYASARSDLLWILDNAPDFPKGTKNDDRNYERIVELYAGLAEQAEGDQRAAYLDTAATWLTTSPQKMKEVGVEYEEYKWELEKGRFAQQFGDELTQGVDGLTNYVDHYRAAFRLAPDKLQAYYINQILQSFDQTEQQKALKFMDQVEAKRGDDEEVMELVAEARKDIFGRNPKAQIEFLEKQLEANPEDKETMASLFELYSEQGNVQEASKLSEQLMDMNPSAETVRKVAKLRLENGKPEAAFQAYKQAEEQGAELSKTDYFSMGQAKQRTGDLRQARTYFRKAIELDDSFGRAYIAIGDLYAKAVSDCGGSKMSRRDRAVYWAAVDMYQKAKSIDSSIASTADSKINTYRQYFPSQEDIFYVDAWEEGESVRIDYGCYSWIGETTRVRRSAS